ncbi:hypothetical protein ABT133_29905 [Streptomyces sp. NPDC001835]
MSALSPAEPELTTQLIGGLLQAAMTAVERGADPHAVADRVLELLRQGLR